MGCCFIKESSSIATPLVLKSDIDAEPEPLSGYWFNRSLNSNTKWTANAYYTLISTLEANLGKYEIPTALIFIIASYSHIGLKAHMSSEAIQIDGTNRLLIHYIPDSDTAHYTDYTLSARGSATPTRCDYIQSDTSFKLLQHDFMGQILYFEVTFYIALDMIPFLKDEMIGISVGFALNGTGGMLGWSQGTIGLHNDDGKVFCTEFSEQSDGRKSLERCFAQENGDTIGCGYNYDTKHVFFTKNGKLISSEKVAFIDLDSSFDPTLVFLSNINMIKSNEFKQMSRQQRECVVEFNFGTKQYKFSIDDYNGQTIPKIMAFMSDLYI